MIRILLVDDQGLVRAGFRSILEKQPDFEVVGEAGNGREALDLAAASAVDVVLMDLRMPVLDGLGATRDLMRSPTPPRIIVLTTFDADEHVYQSLRAGAAGFLLKDTSPERLIQAVREVMSGEAMLSPVITRRLIAAFVNSPAPHEDGVPKAFSSLTDRELDVFRRLAQGASNAEIGKELFLAETTVKTHVAHVLAKLGVRDRVQAVVSAYELGLIRPSGR
ncbi:response regulator [Paeniglutamicibacter cryotolerans]|uniref:DNA-binding NarL/FixJ family response regulator n=1 Tax=Paeniglutamicibacter cryotolerans TaxID=670079 RepID=A0A839QL68_9MICC|nr:response regulator transcription factor [Paeniglutamicibacter cryotolerans]MBB2996550.1 DNA-binding NarL/FixJ family response regulator [Paeniglutamicibacter cryotolerans]